MNGMNEKNNKQKLLVETNNDKPNGAMAFSNDMIPANSLTYGQGKYIQNSPRKWAALNLPGLFLGQVISDIWNAMEQAKFPISTSINGMKSYINIQ